MTLKLIVGLGNPGPQYDGTRHNIGYEVIDLLASRWKVDLGGEKFHAWFGSGTFRGEKVALAKPTTYMNRSGQAVLAAGRFYKLELRDLLVVCDDLALPVGRLRMRAGGSSGSHNGLQDIVDRLGSEEWCRLRIGIGERVGSGSAYVLSRYAPDELAVMERARVRAAEAIECWVTDGPDWAMTRFNGDPPGFEPSPPGGGSSSGSETAPRRPAA